MKMATVRRHALSLGDVTEEPHHHFSSFRVRGRIFLTVPPGDEVIHVFVAEEDRERTMALYPEWTEKLLWGGKVRGLRIRLDSATPAAVKALVSKAYDEQARKR